MANRDNYGTKQSFKLVDEALQYDSTNDNEVAYLKYLESVSVIAMTLLTNRSAGLNNRFTVQQRQNLINTAQQCLERIQSLSLQLDDKLALLPKVTTELSPSKTDKISPAPILDVPSFTQSIDDSKSKCLSILETIDWVSAEDPMNNQTIEHKYMSPLDKAKKINESLMITYEARMSRCRQSNLKINIALELHRRMAENLKIAREQQKQYLQSMQEKHHQRFQEVTRKMSLTGCEMMSDELRIKADLYMEILRYGEKKNWVKDLKKRLLQHSKEEKLIELVVRNTLRDGEHPISKWLKTKTEYLCNDISFLKNKTSKSKASCSINHHKYFSEDKNLMSKTKVDLKKDNTKDSSSKTFEDSYIHNKDDVELAIEVGGMLASQLEESVQKQKSLAKASVKFVKRLQSDKNIACEELEDTCEDYADEEKSYKDELETITSEVSHVYNQLVELFVLSYDQLEDESNREQCSTTLETLFYPDIWSQLSSLCQSVLEDEIVCVSRSMHQMSNITPAELEFSLEDVSMTPDDSCQQVIQLLTHMIKLNVPCEKLRVLVHIFKILCGGCNQPKDANSKNIGADDLIPFLSYICIKSKYGSLLSECYLLERLINPRYMMGEEGYCLTSLQTAIKYIQSCEIDTLEQIPKETTV